MKYILFILLLMITSNCRQSENDTFSAQFIIDTSIETSGGRLIDSSLIKFDFRDKHYTAYRNQGVYRLTREFKTTRGVVEETYIDVLNNDGFQRQKNNRIISIADSMATKYSASVNSVHYFSVLPYGLNDKAVNKERIEDVVINNNSYYSIRVTFSQNGGGEDFEDVFIYWINKETHTVDYLAYSYNEDDGKGLRFRSAYNERRIEGIRFVDYKNYKPTTTNIPLELLPVLFESNDLDLLSTIDLENIIVN